ncbi:hypothetical protein PV10_06425 [Exophiala mesophila]|uniref:Uncharacterized protein n=1 Tax=Exophiala mesophila TaxID=212818 RepID=A0A0D1ZYJ9_EXOME|nr:uncharacterized protein PV10_06425 [Exophiala mesophila]KIV91938.1 hypothetical protein PV10_06425 [Exophiala mesophila]
MSTSPTARRRSGAGVDENLPDPEVDITKTAYFVRPVISGGPHIDALFHNQATMMKMIQDLRFMQAQTLTSSTSGQRDNSRVEQARDWDQAVSTIMASKEMSDTMTGLAMRWVSLNQTNKMAKTRGNRQLPTLANATFAFFKEAFAEEWARDAGDDADVENATDGELVQLLKTMEEKDSLKQELHLALAKRVTMTASSSPERTRNDGDGEGEGEAGAAGPSGRASENEVSIRGRTASAGARGRSRGSSSRRGGRGAGSLARPTAAGEASGSTSAPADDHAEDAEPDNGGSASINEPVAGQASRKRRRVVNDDDDDDYDDVE